MFKRRKNVYRTSADPSRVDYAAEAYRAAMREAQEATTGSESRDVKATFDVINPGGESFDSFEPLRLARVRDLPRGKYVLGRDGSIDFVPLAGDLRDHVASVDLTLKDSDRVGRESEDAARVVSDGFVELSVQHFGQRLHVRVDCEFGAHQVSSRVGASVAGTAGASEPTLGDAPDASSPLGGASGATGDVA